jgi:hypothetical protein
VQKLNCHLKNITEGHSQLLYLNVHTEELSYVATDVYKFQMRPLDVSTSELLFQAYAPEGK